MRIQPKDVWSGDASGTRCRDDEVRRWLRARELGCTRGTLGHANRLCRQLYSSMTKVRSWNPMETANHQHHGGIFNFDFSKDGSVLVAACEKRSILIFDPLNGHLIASKDKAHNDCVNCVRFLDSRVFATCSDDTTVCLWDVRYMKHKVRSLQAHANWVKNIEFDASSGLLVTSGFDGNVFTWDINRYSETEENYKRVFHTPGLMRMKLTPDASKLVVATGSGYLMVIHDLDLTTLSEDLNNFVPNMYHLMQQTNVPVHQAYRWSVSLTMNHVFTQQRNRVELISDFPANNKADMIASLEVHPQGWCVVSRNTSTYEASEWTCVHDIQELHGDSERLTDQQNDSYLSPEPHQSSNEQTPGENVQVAEDTRPNSTEPSRTGSPAFVLSVSINESVASPPSISQSNSASTATAAEGDRETDEPHHPAAQSSDPLSSSSVQFDLTQSIERQDSSDDSDAEGYRHHDQSTIDLARLARWYRLTNTNRGGQPLGPVTVSSEIVGRSPENDSDVNQVLNQLPSAVDVLPSLHVQRTTSNTTSHSSLVTQRQFVHSNSARLTHYVEELNVGRGFIKEVSFSSDGRLICSPYGFGVRLLAFDADCSEICDIIPRKPVKLYPVTSNMSHTSAVVTTKFSPWHCMFVSGCLSGKVDFHQPLI